VNTTAPLEVFFDGACHLCSREIDHYRDKVTNNNIVFVDISDPGFSLKKAGLEGADVQKYMHVRKPSGEIVTGVSSFLAIWETLDVFEPLQWSAKNPFIRPVMNLGYEAFAFVRPYLPKKYKCDSNGCRI